MQVLNYPLLARIGPDSFPEYEREHNRRFIRVVGPGVIATIITTIGLLVSRPRGVPVVGESAIAVLIVTVIVSTALWQAPAHERLAQGYDAGIHARLVRTNWFRTLCWTVIGVLDLWLVSRLA